MLGDDKIVEEVAVDRASLLAGDDAAFDRRRVGAAALQAFERIAKRDTRGDDVMRGFCGVARTAGVPESVERGVNRRRRRRTNRRTEDTEAAKAAERGFHTASTVTVAL